MASKHGHNRRKYKKRLKNELRKDTSLEDDIEVIGLLYEQINSLIIFLASDIYFFQYAINLIYEIISDNEEKKFYFFRVSVNLLKANFLALCSSIYTADINNKRYIMQRQRKSAGKIFYSLRAERTIAISSIMLVLLFLFQLIGAAGIFKRGFLNSSDTSESESLRICLMEMRAFQIRYWADCFLIKSSISSIELVRSRYSTENTANDKNENPDIPAVIAGELYFVQRTMLLYANIIIYRNLLEEYSEENENYILNPNIIIIIGNILGEGANMSILAAYIEIYMRNVTQPIFG